MRPASDSVIVEAGAAGEAPGQLPRFRSAAENEDACHACFLFLKRRCPDAIEPDTAASPRWLSIVGIGEDGVEGLSPVARGLIGAAEIVFGGRRHLGLAAPLIRGATRPWPSPFDAAPDEVLHHRGRQVCVLASGDPFHYGVGSALARRIDAREMTVIPAPSAFSLAAARLGWSLPQTALISVHGRSLDLVRPHLQPGTRILALTSDGQGPAALAKLLTQSGFGGSRLTVLEALGGSYERIRSASAAAFDLGAVDALNTVAIEVEAAADARVLARTPGLSDALFEHDGQITKREIRAVTHLVAGAAPRRIALGYRRRLGLGRHRMDAGRSVDARRRHRAASGSRGAHPPQRRGVRRSRPRDRGRRRAGRARRTCRHPTPFSSAAA